MIGGARNTLHFSWVALNVTEPKQRLKTAWQLALTAFGAGDASFAPVSVETLDAKAAKVAVIRECCSHKEEIAGGLSTAAADVLLPRVYLCAFLKLRAPTVHAVRLFCFLNEPVRRPIRASEEADAYTVLLKTALLWTY